MSSGTVNKVILIGRLGKDPDVRSTATGLTVANIRLATNHSVKNKETGEWQEATEWHTVVFFDRTAEVVRQYLRKGSQIYVEGSIRTEKWQDQNGQDRYTTKIIADSMQMLGSRSDSAGYRGETPTSYAAPVASNRPQTSPSYVEEANLPPLPPDLPPAGDSNAPSTGQRWSGGSSSPPAKNFDDDVPF